MKLMLYLLGSVALAGAALAMALLPHLAPSLWVFLAGGALLSLLGAGGWLVLSASAGNWPRLHSGPVLAAAGVLGLALGLLYRNWQQAGWGVLLILGGVPLWVAWCRTRAKNGQRGGAAVRPPIGRREQA